MPQYDTRNQNCNLDMTKYDKIHKLFHVDKEKVKAYDHLEPASMIRTVSRGQGFLIFYVV